jgi:hypothetical protein
VAYDEDLANRVRELIAAESGFAEKRMFVAWRCCWTATWPWWSVAALAAK